MGGKRSGRGPWSERYTTQDCLDLSISKLYKWDILPPVVGQAGRISWSWPGVWKSDDSVRYEVRRGNYYDGWVIELTYTLTDNRTGEREYIKTPISLDTTIPHFGGLRYWFICPRCEERKAVLYKHPERTTFACRNCHDLVYKTQRLDKLNRAYKRLKNIHEKLGAPSEVFIRFPKKPKHMHWTTYYRLRQQAREADKQIAGAVYPMLRSVLNRVKSRE